MWHTACSCALQRPQEADDYIAGGPLSMQEKNPNLGDEQKKKPGEYGETGKQGGQGQGDAGKKGGDYGDTGKKREGVDTGEVDR
jgi:hypothetical protein